MIRWSDDQMVRWSDDQMIRWSDDDQMIRWSDDARCLWLKTKPGGRGLDQEEFLSWSQNLCQVYREDANHQTFPRGINCDVQFTETARITSGSCLTSCSLCIWSTNLVFVNQCNCNGCFKFMCLLCESHGTTNQSHFVSFHSFKFNTTYLALSPSATEINPLQSKHAT